MVPTTVIESAMAELLAADTGTLAAVAAMHVHLIVEPFVPSVNTDFTTLTEATFTGGADKSAGTGTQQVFLDPTTGNRVIQLLEPAGGWTWECTADPVAPQTVYGYVVTDNADAVTYGSELLETPVEITEAGQGLTINNIRINIPPGLLS